MEIKSIKVARAEEGRVVTIEAFYQGNEEITAPDHVELTRIFEEVGGTIGRDPRRGSTEAKSEGGPRGRSRREPEPEDQDEKPARSRRGASEEPAEEKPARSRRGSSDEGKDDTAASSGGRSRRGAATEEEQEEKPVGRRRRGEEEPAEGRRSRGSSSDDITDEDLTKAASSFIEKDPKKHKAILADVLSKDLGVETVGEIEADQRQLFLDILKFETTGEKTKRFAEFEKTGK